MSAHNISDDNTVSVFAKIIHELEHSLKLEFENAMKRFSGNKTIVNPDNFKAIVISKSDYIEQSVSLLRNNLDDKLNFHFLIRKISKSASSQLNALIRLKPFLGSSEIKVLIDSFILSNFDYCSIAWFFSSAKFLNNVENLQRRALRILFNDYHSSYEELLKKSGKATINLQSYRILCTENFKILSNLNPVFLKNIFLSREIERPVQNKYKLNLAIPKRNQVKFGFKSLKYLGPTIWNTLPHHIKSSKNLKNLKKKKRNSGMVKTVNGFSFILMSPQYIAIFLLLY